MKESIQTQDQVSNAADHKVVLRRTQCYVFVTFHLCHIYAQFLAMYLLTYLLLRRR